jgi:hypothetical protein
MLAEASAPPSYRGQIVIFQLGQTSNVPSVSVVKWVTPECAEGDPWAVVRSLRALPSASCPPPR